MAQHPQRQFFQEKAALFVALKRMLTKFFVILLPYGWHIIFFLIPFLIVLKISFSESIIGAPPYTQIFAWVDDAFLQIRLNIGNYLFLIEDHLYLASYLESLKLAAIATIGCLLLGYPMAYALTRLKGTARTFGVLLVILPFWTSFLIRVYAWIGILSTKGLLNTALINMGLISEPLQILDTNIAVTIGLIYSYLPFMVLPLYSSLEKIDPSVIEAAYDLGAKPLRTFFKVIMPLSYRGIIGGAMLVFIPSVGEFVIPALLGGSNTIMIGKVLWTEFFTNADWPLAAALVVALFILLFIPIFFFQKFLQREEQAWVEEETL